MNKKEKKAVNQTAGLNLLLAVLKIYLPKAYKAHRYRRLDRRISGNK